MSFLIVSHVLAEGGHSHSVFTSSGGSLTSPFIFNNSVETTAPFNVVSHDVVSLEINPWKNFDLLLGSNL